MPEFIYLQRKNANFDLILNPAQYLTSRLASYRVEYTSSRSITEVKLRRAGLVLTWVTGWEYLVC